MANEQNILYITPFAYDNQSRLSWALDRLRKVK